MKKINPIDKKRNSSGYAEIGTNEDGAIVGMYNIGNRLLIIKEQSVYEMAMADDIDPDRTNINLPTNIQKLIINQGSESEIVSRTLLTALALFKPEYLRKEIECNALISLSMNLLSEFSILIKEINEYIDYEKSEINQYSLKAEQNNSLKLPSIINLETICKTIFQKIDHVEQVLIHITMHFYPNIGLKKQSHFPKLYDKMKEIYGSEDGFVKSLFETLNFMEIVRELRNGLDHRLEHTNVVDFELYKNGQIISPSIELKHKKTTLEKMSLSVLLETSLSNLTYIVELLFVNLADKNIKESGLPYQIKYIPVEKRRNKYIHYGLWLPLGKDGFYKQ